MKIRLVSFVSFALACSVVLMAARPVLAQSDSKPGVAASSPTASPGPVIVSRTPAKIVDDFFAKLKTNSVDAAYVQLLQGSKIADSPTDVANLKAKTREAIQAFGEIVDYDLIWSKQVGNHLLCSTYISAGKFYPFRWRFYFYKATDTWRLIDMRTDDRLMGMFEDQGSVATPVPTPQ